MTNCAMPALPSMPSAMPPASAISKAPCAARGRQSAPWPRRPESRSTGTPLKRTIEMRSYKVENGVVDLGRIKLDVPDTISEEAKAYLRFDPEAQMPEDTPRVPMWHLREPLAPMFEWLNQQALEVFPCDIEETAIEGVRCHRITPKGGIRHAGKLLINLHGGGFVMRSGSPVEAIPIAAEPGCEV